LAGAVVGAIGGLFAVGIVDAITQRNLSLIVKPTLGVIGLLLSGPSGWLLGGQIGPRFGEAFRSVRAEIAGGVLGGLVPVVLVALWAWWYWSTH
jgi:hypothetical protein